MAIAIETEVQGTSHAVAIRLFVLLLPAVCCSWIALQTTLRYDHHRRFQAADDLDHGRPYNLPIEVRQGSTSREEYLNGHSLPMNASISDCFRLNSKEWLEGPRIGNSNDDNNTADTELLFQRLILDVPNLFGQQENTRQLLQHSLCHENSRFLSSDTAQDERLWTVRLIYFALHAHQFLPALDEARVRHHYAHEDSCSNERNARGIGMLDYECPSAKFLVVSLAKSGLGSNIRLGAVPAFMAGLATDRVVLFVNNSPVGPRFLREPWALSSCDRRDAQCFFLPASPCVITHAELGSAYQLQKKEMRHMFRHGLVPRDHQDDRVLIVNLKFRPQRMPMNLRPALHNLSVPLLDQLPYDDERLPMLKAAASRILEDDPPTTTAYAYIGVDSPVYHALVLFFLRPNPNSALQIKDILQDILPSDYDPNHAVGLPIRASDKCGVESECVSFPTYMRAIAGTVQHDDRYRYPSSQQRETSIIVTTESQKVLREMNEFASNATLQSSVPFPFRLVTNHHDVAQDTGYLEDIADHPTLTADAAMLSAVSSLKAQLSTRVTVGNCCSNFHLLLADLLSEGCGAVPDSTFQCLQDHPDPEFRICCAWDKSPECHARRNLTSALG